MVFNNDVVERAAWIGPDVQNSNEWLLHLTEIELQEIDLALKNIKKNGIKIPFNKEEFVLPSLSKKIHSLYDVLENQLGFVLLRGIDRDKYTDEECELIYWGIGIHLGKPVSQNTRGHLLLQMKENLYQILQRECIRPNSKWISIPTSYQWMWLVYFVKEKLKKEGQAI